MPNFAFKHHVDAHRAHQTHDSHRAVLDSVCLFWRENCFVLPDICKTVLDYIARYAKHVYGVCWMKKETIAAELQISRSTVWRALKQLIEKGIIEKHHEKHKDGGRRSFVVIKTYTSHFENEALTIESDASDDVAFDNLATLIDTLDETLPTDSKTPVSPYVPSDSSIEPQPRNKEPNSALNIFPYSSTENESVTKLNVKSTKFPQSKFANFDSIKKTLAIPSYFHDAIKTYVDAETLYQLWDRTEICHKSVGAKAIFTDIVTESWNTTFKMMKQGRMESKDIIGLYYGILRNQLLEYKAHLSQNGGFHDDFIQKQPNRKSGKFADHEPFITKHKRRLIKNIMKINNIPFQEAFKRLLL